MQHSTCVKQLIKVDNFWGSVRTRQPDREVGVAMEGLIVGSVDVAHDFFLLKQ